jgi:photosystem II stability/assembly factor-like uncharacterized protein
MQQRFTKIILCLVVFAVVLKLAIDTPRAALPSGTTFIEKESEEQEAGYAYEALCWYNNQRAYPTGRIPEDWRTKAFEHIKQNNLLYNKADVAATSALSWISVGPDNIGGRTRSVAIDPTNPNVIYCGSVSGGIWKTTNAGASWFPTSYEAVNLVIGSIVIDPTNHNIIYAGTGEGYFNVDALRGAGVLKSTNGGESWSLLTDFNKTSSPYQYYFINKLVIRPDNPNILYAALIGGIWKTTDAGAHWSKLTVTSKTSFCTDILMHPSKPDTMYATFGLFTPDGIYKTTNGGTSWTKLSGGFPSSGYGRISLAIAPSNPSIMYASLTDLEYYTHSIQKSINGGASWSAVKIPFDNSPAVDSTHLGGQGWYNNVIAVHPTDPKIVYAGGINLFKSTNSGTSWSRISDGYATGSTYVHVDQHAITFHPSDPSIIYFGNDGGMFKSTDGGSSFSELNNGLVTAQFYSGAAHPTADVYYGGTQDNGTLKSGTLPHGTTVFGGDGGATAVDYVTPATVYTEYVYLSFQKSTASGAFGTWTRMMNGIPTSGSGQSDGTSDRCSFIAPFVMDPSNPQTLVAGTFRLFRTTNGGVQWNSISQSLSNNGDMTGDGDGSNQVSSQKSWISAIAIAKSSPATIYVGTGGSKTAHSKVWVTTNTGSSWTEITGTLPDRYVKSIAIDPNNRDRAIVTFSGYDASHVFLTTNRGTHWTNISGDLPNIPVNSVVIDPSNINHFVAGTDLGVFETSNGGTNWLQQNNGMANVSVADLDLRADGYLFAATHGRGMFKSVNPFFNILKLAYPKNNATQQSITPKLQWNALLAAVSYRVQVATDSTFTTGIVLDDSTVVDTFKTVGRVAYGTKYFWHIISKSGSGQKYSSEIWSFTTFTTTLASPSNGGTYQTTTLKLHWDSLTTAVSYKVQVATDSTFTTGIVLNDSSITNTFKIVNGLANNTKYFWHVIAMDSDRNFIMSAIWNFSTVPVYAATLALNTTVSFPVHDNASEYESTDYRLAGLPGASNELVATLLTGSQNKDWQIYWDNGAPDNYFVQYDGSSNFELSTGKGFWVINKGTWVINTTVPSAPLDTNGEVIIPLQGGWNIITNPFTIPLVWASVQNVNAISNPIWTFNGSLDTSSQFLPYAGYWYKNAGDKPYLKIPYGNVSSGTSISNGFDFKSWRVNIILKVGELVDRITSLGVSPQASTSLDCLDITKPRAIAAVPATYFNRPDLDAIYSSFATDIRPEFYDLQSWEFEVHSARKKASQLTFSGIRRTPPQFEVYLVDEGSALYVNLRNDSVYNFTPATDIMAFRVIVGKEELVKENLSSVLPKEFALGNNYPNPFNPTTTIPVGIPLTTDVTLTLYNILGEQIKTIFTGTLAAGRYSFTWDGRNQSGNSVASGVYLYRLTTESGVNVVRKMVLLK